MTYRIVRLATLLLAVAQLAVVFAPCIDARSGPNIGAHVEEHGSPRHIVHDEALCAACTAHHLVGRIERPTPLLAGTFGRPSAEPRTALWAIPAQFALTNSSRAPPPES
jgi:hypothetical protein